MRYIVLLSLVPPPSDHFGRIGTATYRIVTFARQSHRYLLYAQPPIVVGLHSGRQSRVARLVTSMKASSVRMLHAMMTMVMTNLYIIRVSNDVIVSGGIIIWGRDVTMVTTWPPVAHKIIIMFILLLFVIFLLLCHFFSFIYRGK